MISYFDNIVKVWRSSIKEHHLVKRLARKEGIFLPVTINGYSPYQPQQVEGNNLLEKCVHKVLSNLACSWKAFVHLTAQKLLAPPNRVAS